MCPVRNVTYVSGRSLKTHHARRQRTIDRDKTSYHDPFSLFVIDGSAVGFSIGKQPTIDPDNLKRSDDTTCSSISNLHCFSLLPPWVARRTGAGGAGVKCLLLGCAT